MELENLFIKQMSIGPMMNFAYLVGDRFKKEAVLIDPGWEGKRLIKEAGENGFEIISVLVTHTHFDHANEIRFVSDELSVPVCVHRAEAKQLQDVQNIKELSDGDKIQVGEFYLEVIHTPGHSKGSVCFVIDSVIFTGDTLFVDGIGRTDLEGGDSEEMFMSLAKIKKMSDGMIIYPGHNYGHSTNSTIGEQKKTNPYLVSNSLSDFLRIV